MWDRPGALNALSNLLFASTAAFAAWTLLHWAAGLSYFAPRVMTVRGMTAHVARDEVSFIARRRLRDNFFAADIDGVRQDFEKLPWVRSVSVTRSWPLEIDVKIEEHVPIARWGVDQLVDSYGDVFEASTDVALPQFSGPAGSSREVSREYVAFSRTMAVLNRKVAVVSLSDRRSWALHLDDGMVIELGRSRMEKRLSDFAALYGNTVGRLDKKIDYVDLRYDNGFAVRIPGMKVRARGAA